MSRGSTLRGPRTFDDDGEDDDDDGEDEDDDDDDDEDKCQEGVSTLRCPQTFDDVTDRPQNTDVKRNVSSIQLNTNFLLICQKTKMNVILVRFSARI